MFLVKVIIIAVLSFILTLFLPWYGVAIAAFITGLVFSNKPGNNFLAGFFGVGLSSKIATLFSENIGTEITTGVLIMVTTFLGALLGALSSMVGAMIMDDGSRMRRRRAIKRGNYKLKLN